MNQPQEGWEHQESVDDKLIEGDDFDTEVTIYQGKPYPTINAYFALATKLGMTIDEVVEQDVGNEWVVRTRAAWCTDPEMPRTPKTVMYRWGAATEKKSDRHGYAKAWGKAQRNAFKGFLRGHPEMKKAIEEFMAQAEIDQNGIPNPTPPRQQARPQQAPQPPAEETPQDRARTAYTRKSKELTRMGLNGKVLWPAVLHHNKLEEWSEMPDSAWKEVEVMLNTMDTEVLAEWVAAMQIDS